MSLVCMLSRNGLERVLWERAAVRKHVIAISRLEVPDLMKLED
jgi:hypothetical protein